MSEHYPAYTHDFTIFKSRIEMYKKLLKKTQDEKNMEDEKYPDQWLLIADSSYTGASKYLTAKTVEKRSQQKTSNQKKLNKLLSKDRVACENFYWRLLNLFIQNRRQKINKSE